VVVRDHDHVDEGDFGDFTWSFCVSLGAEPGEWRAAVFEDGVEEYAQATWEFDVEAGVAEPGGAEFWGFARGEECRRVYGDGWGGCVGSFGFAGEDAPGTRSDCIPFF
jgi:hypothetical protein